MTSERFDCRITRKEGVAGGHWCVNGVPIFVLMNRLGAGDSIERLADDYDLSPQYVETALAFYRTVVISDEYPAIREVSSGE